MGTGITGTPSAKPIPFAVAAPILSPVKEPGPAVVTTASISLKGKGMICFICSIIGMRDWECVF